MQVELNKIQLCFCFDFVGVDHLGNFGRAWCVPSGRGHASCLRESYTNRISRGGIVRGPAAGLAGEGRQSLLGPIFAREWLTVPRRSRHYVMRAAYLGGPWILG